MAIKINKNNWQALADAETLAEYQEIMADNKRKTAAIRAAKKKADDLDKRADMLKRATGGKINRRK